jgi:hypothetical protein
LKYFEVNYKIFLTIVCFGVVVVHVMGEKYLFRKGSQSIALVALWYLSSGLNAAAPEAADFDLRNRDVEVEFVSKDGDIEVAFEPDDGVFFGVDLEQRDTRNLNDILGFRAFEESYGMPVGEHRVTGIVREQIGKGSRGTVWGGVLLRSHSAPLAVAIKQSNSEEMVDDLLQEFHIAGCIFWDMLAYRNSRDRIPASISLHMRSLVLPFYQKIDHDQRQCISVQRRVQGSDIFRTISEKVRPYSGGVPHNYRRALLLAAEFFGPFAILHRIGWGFNDVHCGNFVVELSGLTYVVRIIDFGLAQRLGEPLAFIMLSLPPWALPPEHRLERKLFRRFDSAFENRKLHIRAEAGNPEEGRRRVEEFQERFLPLWLRTREEHGENVQVTAAFDIYRSTRVLEALLFGLPRLDVDGKRFSREYAQGLLRERGRGYPQPIFNRIELIVQAMLETDPMHRPSAEVIAQALRILAYTAPGAIETILGRLGDSPEDNIFLLVDALGRGIIANEACVPVLEDNDQFSFAEAAGTALLAVFGEDTAIARMGGLPPERQHALEVIARALLLLFRDRIPYGYCSQFDGGTPVPADGTPGPGDGTPVLDDDILDLGDDRPDTDDDTLVFDADLPDIDGDILGFDGDLSDPGDDLPGPYGNITDTDGDVTDFD